MFSDRTWEDNRKKKRGLPMLAALLCGCGVKDIEEQAEASKNKGAFRCSWFAIASHCIPCPYLVVNWERVLMQVWSGESELDPRD